MKRYCRRSWGWWLVLLDRQHFKVKLLKFRAGGRCSNQLHRYRSELWLILKGCGKMNNRMLFAGDFHTVPWAQIHQYIAKIPTLVLEIQYGQKCQEDDIIRI